VTLLDPVEGKKEAQELVGKLLALQPDGNATNYGTLKISPKDKSKRVQIPMRLSVVVASRNWTNIYETMPTNSADAVQQLFITHDGTNFGRYSLINKTTNSWYSVKLSSPDRPLHDEMLLPFAGSDFAIGDLGLEFLHWPAQRIVKKEIKRSCGCSVLESLNPDPNSKGYSKVLTWFDNDSLGVVQAEAYDAKGDLLKEFIPKSVTKVNGQWQVDEIEMDNIQTGSRTVITFDVNK